MCADCGQCVIAIDKFVFQIICMCVCVFVCCSSRPISCLTNQNYYSTCTAGIFTCHVSHYDSRRPLRNPCRYDFWKCDGHCRICDGHGTLGGQDTSLCMTPMVLGQPCTVRYPGSEFNCNYTTSVSICLTYPSMHQWPWPMKRNDDRFNPRETITWSL